MKSLKIRSALLIGLGFMYFANAQDTTATFNALNDWQGNSKNISEGNNGTLIFTGPGQIISQKIISVNTDRAYRISGEFRLPAGAAPVKLSWGLQIMDAQKTVFAAVNVDGVKSTETELSEPCNPEDTTIKIKDGTKWQQRAPSTIAFSIDDSGKYLDYPNFNTLTVQIAKIEKTPDGYDVQLKGKCGKTFPAGTKIRQHLLSGAFLYLTSGQELNQEWKQFSYIINGQAPSGVVSGSWWPRTAFARLIIPNKKAGIIEFKNIIIEETSK